MQMAIAIIFLQQLVLGRKSKAGLRIFKMAMSALPKLRHVFKTENQLYFLVYKMNMAREQLNCIFCAPFKGLYCPSICFVKSQYLIEYGKQKFSGTTGQQRFGTDEVKKTLFPLPPLVEQDRIIKQVEIILEKLKDED